MAGSLIGKGGHNIQNLRTSFNCNVSFLTSESYKLALWNVNVNGANIYSKEAVNVFLISSARFKTVPLKPEQK